MSDTTLQVTAAQAALVDESESRNHIFASRDMAKNVFSVNVLENTSGGSGNAVVSTFTLNGTTYQAGEVAKTDDGYVNAFTIKPDGSYVLDVNGPYADFASLTANYTVTDGSETAASWTTHTGRWGASSGENQYYTSGGANAVLNIGNNTMAITARQETPPDNAVAPNDYTSARMVTMGKRSVEPPVRIVARIKMPYILPVYCLRFGWLG